jgi:hypothetical protein
VSEGSGSLASEVRTVSVEWDKDAIDRIAREAGKKAMDVARRAASGARCPDHRKASKITGVDQRTGEFTIEACCEKGKKAATDAIARALK